jgi:hypothetical protein
VSESRRQKIPLLSDYLSCVYSQLAPPSYSQPSLAELLRAAWLDCDYPRGWYQKKVGLLGACRPRSAIRVGASSAFWQHEVEQNLTQVGQ